MIRVSKNLRQDITIWTVTPDGYGMSYGTPTTVKGRWEDWTEKIIKPDGEEFVSKARIFLAVAVSVGSYLYLGSSTLADPTTLENAHRAEQVFETPNLRNLQTLYKVYL